MLEHVTYSPNVEPTLRDCVIDYNGKSFEIKKITKPSGKYYKITDNKGNFMLSRQKLSCPDGHKWAVRDVQHIITNWRL